MRTTIMKPGKVALIFLTAALLGVSARSHGRVEPGAGIAEARAADQAEQDAVAYLPLLVYPPQARTIYGAIDHGQGQREYILHMPSSYDGRSPAPLIINYHAYANDAAAQMGYGDFRAVAEKSGALVLHPQGALWQGVRRWNVGGIYSHPLVDDVAFTAALLDAIFASYNVDPDRIYAAGFSNGAYMSYLVACQLSDRFAAVAPVAGAMMPEMFAECNPGRPLPVLHVHGLDDAVVPFYGDPGSAAVPETLEYWIAANGADPTPSIEALPDVDPADGSTVEHWVYGAGQGGVTVELLLVTGGGHTWPGSAVPLPGTNYDIDASAEIWDFFAKYDISGRRSVAGDWWLVASNW